MGSGDNIALFLAVALSAMANALDIRVRIVVRSFFRPFVGCTIWSVHHACSVCPSPLGLSMCWFLFNTHSDSEPLALCCFCFMTLCIDLDSVFVAMVCRTGQEPSASSAPEPRRGPAAAVDQPRSAQVCARRSQPHIAKVALLCAAVAARLFAADGDLGVPEIPLSPCKNCRRAVIHACWLHCCLVRSKGHEGVHRQEDHLVGGASGAPRL